MLVKAEKRLFFFSCCKKNKNTITPFFAMHIYLNTLFCKSYIIYKKTLMYSQKKSPKGIFLFLVPLHIHIVQDSPHLHASNASHIFFFFFFSSFLQLKFLFLFFLAATSQRKVFNYVQLIRSDGTPPTQAPPSNSGCPSPLLRQFRCRRLGTVCLDMR